MGAPNGDFPVLINATCWSASPLRPILEREIKRVRETIPHMEGDAQANAVLFLDQLETCLAQVEDAFQNRRSTRRR